MNGANALVQVEPFQYGKRWAYGVEIDDGPATTVSVAVPLLAKYSFTDSPPGLAGGKPLPFVGTSAIFLLRFDSGNPTLMTGEQANTLREAGWGIINHSYWHTGNHWDKTKALSPADFRRELYWSQALWPALVGQGRAASTFVYPNGDPGYRTYMKEFGLRAGSRVGGKTTQLPQAEDGWGDLGRNWLDENVWSKSNDPLQGIPVNAPGAAPPAGTVLVDFAHGISAEPSSPNYQRWQARLAHIATQWGQGGDDSVWCAPTDAIVAYDLNARSARVSLMGGRLQVKVPDDLPGSRLTLRIKGVPQNARWIPPAGTVLYRKGDEVWLTTPPLGPAGSAPPLPALERIYSGEVRNVILDWPRKIAGVRICQSGTPKAGMTFAVAAVRLDGTSFSLLPAGYSGPGSAWGSWLLFNAVPDGPAPIAGAVNVSADPAFKRMEIWALKD